MSVPFRLATQKTAKKKERDGSYIVKDAGLKLIYALQKSESEAGKHCSITPFKHKNTKVYVIVHVCKNPRKIWGITEQTY